jgi:hydroxypyruvate reductase
MSSTSRVARSSINRRWSQPLADESIAGAGLDVFENEPHAPDALTAFSNVVLTPHVGGHTLESHVAMQNCVMANLEAFFAGKPLPYEVRDA